MIHINALAVTFASILLAPSFVVAATSVPLTEQKQANIYYFSWCLKILLGLFSSSWISASVHLSLVLSVSTFVCLMFSQPLTASLLVPVVVLRQSSSP